MLKKAIKDYILDYIPIIIRIYKYTKKLVSSNKFYNFTKK